MYDLAVGALFEFEVGHAALVLVVAVAAVQFLFGVRNAVFLNDVQACRDEVDVAVELFFLSCDFEVFGRSLCFRGCSCRCAVAEMG